MGSQQLLHWKFFAAIFGGGAGIWLSGHMSYLLLSRFSLQGAPQLVQPFMIRSTKPSTEGIRNAMNI